jgi:hypothetical protein
MARASAPRLLLCALLTLAAAHGATLPADTQALLQFKGELSSDGVRSLLPVPSKSCNVQRCMQLVGSMLPDVKTA